MRDSNIFVALFTIIVISALMWFPGSRKTGVETVTLTAKVSEGITQHKGNSQEMLEQDRNDTVVPLERNLETGGTAENGSVAGVSAVRARLERGETAYVEVLEEGLRVRSGPGTEYTTVDAVIQTKVAYDTLKGGMVFPVSGVASDKEDRAWYKIGKDPLGIRYPERRISEWFIASWYTRPVDERAVTTVFPATVAGDKWIRIDLSDQKLVAYEGEQAVFEATVTTGGPETENLTPAGEFKVLRKITSRYMQGKNEKEGRNFDLPGIPYVLYFTDRGHTILGAYWQSWFGSNTRGSLGCVQVPVEKMEWLYHWASVGTRIVIEK